MKTNIVIPKKCKVGFNPRNDTYTGMLGYVIYHDGKVWRKEKSWEDWRYKFVDESSIEIDKRKSYDNFIKYIFTNLKYTKERNPTLTETTQWINGRNITVNLDSTIDEIMELHKYSEFSYSPHKQSSNPNVKPLEFDNVPIEGFVLNKKVGGYSTGWDHRQTYCRVYDPRGFEFEITIPNLLYILENTNSIKGKGLEGNFVYGWDGKDLVLLPESAPEYEALLKFNEKLQNRIKKSELVKGYQYMTKTNEVFVYMGEYEVFDSNGISSGKKLIWHNPNRIYKSYPEGNPHRYASSFITKDIGSFIDCVSDNSIENFANLISIMENTMRYFQKTEVTFNDHINFPTYRYKYSPNEAHNCYLKTTNKNGDAYTKVYQLSEKYGKYYIRLTSKSECEEFNTMNELLKKYNICQVAQKTTK